MLPKAPRLALSYLLKSFSACCRLTYQFHFVCARPVDMETSSAPLAIVASNETSALIPTFDRQSVNGRSLYIRTVEL